MSVYVETLQGKPANFPRRTYDLFSLPTYDLGATIKSRTTVTTSPSRSCSASPPIRKSNNELKLKRILAKMSEEREEEREGFEKTIRNLKMENEKLRTENESSLKRTEELENELQHFRKLYNQHRKENITLKNDNIVLQNSLTIERDLVANVEREKSKLRDKLLSENDSLKKKLEERNSVVARLDREVINAQTAATRAQKGADVLQEELAREKKLHKQALRVRDEGRTIQENLQQQLNTETRGREEAEERLQRANASLVDAVGRATQKDRELQELKQRHADVQNEGHRVRRDFDERVQALQNELDQGRKMETALKTEADVGRRRFASAEAEIGKLRTANEKNVQQLTDLRAEVECAHRAADVAAAEKERLQQSLLSREREVAVLKSKNAQLAEENNQEKDSHDRVVQEAQTLQGRLQACENTLARTRDEDLKRLMDKEREFNEREQSLKKEIRYEQTKQLKLHTESVELKGTKGALADENRRLLEELEQARRDRDTEVAELENERSFNLTTHISLNEGKPNPNDSTLDSFSPERKKKTRERKNKEKGRTYDDLSPHVAGRVQSPPSPYDHNIMNYDVNTLFRLPNTTTNRPKSGTTITTKITSPPNTTVSSFNSPPRLIASVMGSPYHSSDGLYSDM